MKNVYRLLKKGPDVQKYEKCLLIAFKKGGQTSRLFTNFSSLACDPCFTCFYLTSDQSSLSLTTAEEMTKQHPVS